MIAPEILARIQVELDRAEAARAAGFEGRARVSARRAAGAAIQAYCESHRIALEAFSAYEILQAFHDRPDLSPRVREVIEHLLARVNEDFALPIPVDLLAETRWLVDTLDKDGML